MRAYPFVLVTLFLAGCSNLPGAIPTASSELSPITSQNMVIWSDHSQPTFGSENTRCHSASQYARIQYSHCDADDENKVLKVEYMAAPPQPFYTLKLLYSRNGEPLRTIIDTVIEHRAGTVQLTFMPGRIKGPVDFVGGDYYVEIDGVRSGLMELTGSTDNTPVNKEEEWKELPCWWISEV